MADDDKTSRVPLSDDKSMLPVEVSQPQQVETDSNASTITALASEKDLGKDIIIGILLKYDIWKLPKSNPTWLEAFLGYYYDVHEKLQAMYENVYKQIEAAEADKERSDTSQLKSLHDLLLNTLHNYNLTPMKRWLYQWSYFVLLGIYSVVQFIIVELYVRWHGTTLLTTDFYSSNHINILSQMNFVNGMTTMSVAAEILTWSSIGVWAYQAYYLATQVPKNKFRFAEHGIMYGATLMRNTAVAAAVVLLLRLTQFSVFGISLEEGNPLAFDATIGLSFLLGFFGDDATKLLLRFKDTIVGGVEKA